MCWNQADLHLSDLSKLKGSCGCESSLRSGNIVHVAPLVYGDYKGDTRMDDEKEKSPLTLSVKVQEMDILHCARGFVAYAS